MYPADWTPVDSLVVQGDLTEELDFTTTPLDYALLERSLGAKRTMAWFPVLPPNQQNPYDPGPYRNAGLVPLQSGMSTSNSTSSATKTARRTPAPPHRRRASPAGAARRARRRQRHRAGATAASALLAQVNAPARGAGPPLPGQQRVGGQRPGGGRRQVHAGR